MVSLETARNYHVVKLDSIFKEIAGGGQNGIMYVSEIISVAAPNQFHYLLELHIVEGLFKIYETSNQIRF